MYKKMEQSAALSLPNIKSRIAARTPSLLHVANKTKSQSTSKLYV